VTGAQAAAGAPSETSPPIQQPQSGGALHSAKTVRELKACGHRPVSVREEIRRNLIAMIRRKEPLFPGIIGYDRTVVPQILNALLSRHDFILLGLRGQAKTRILRGLTAFLDEAIPVVDGCEVHDDPLAPVCAACRRRLREAGDDLPVAWLPRDERYQEKLATPDVTIADLIGDIDPIKAAAQRLSFSDEGAIHYGIIPRSNRGIFAINELPDLQPRIQVGLLNILEERDIQIRGFPVRIPLDLLLVFSANPEDYTNRGNIITPLRDRIASQIMTHYPLTLQDAMQITTQESWTERDTGVQVVVPPFLRELIEEVAIQARKSEYVDQSSGVSARLTIALIENVVSNAERRGLSTSQNRTTARVCDLAHAASAVSGKVELVYEGEQEGPASVARHLIGRAVKSQFSRLMPDAYRTGRKSQAPEEGATSSEYREIVEWFSRGGNIEISDEMADPEFRLRLDSVRGLDRLARKYLKPSGPDEEAVMMEFILEGLHQFSILSKERMDGGAITYSDMLKSMFSGLGQGATEGD
jgi:magnesium chelatase subunit I